MYVFEDRKKHLSNRYMDMHARLSIVQVRQARISVNIIRDFSRACHKKHLHESISISVVAIAIRIEGGPTTRLATGDSSDHSWMNA